MRLLPSGFAVLCYMLGGFHRLVPFFTEKMLYCIIMLVAHMFFLASAHISPGSIVCSKSVNCKLY